MMFFARYLKNSIESPKVSLVISFEVYHPSVSVYTKERLFFYDRSLLFIIYMHIYAYMYHTYSVWYIQHVYVL
jgi:hypothetical protein